MAPTYAIPGLFISIPKQIYAFEQIQPIALSTIRHFNLNKCWLISPNSVEVLFHYKK